MPSRPPLSVVIAARHGISDLAPVLEALLPQARATATEVLVTGPADGPVPDGVRLIEVEDPDIYELRRIAIREARGEIVAIGEDHAVPRPDWCEAVLRSHAERPGAAAIIGCLANLTDRTLSGRANFLAFAAPFSPPMRRPPRRPPPVSALSFKREALAGVDDLPGRFESMLVPRLFEEGGMVVDDRVVLDHFQDHGVLWAIANGFHGARASYGFLRARLGWRERLSQARWGLRNWPPRLSREARETRTGSRLELAIVAAIACGVGLGSAVGSLAGPGSSPERVA